MGSALQYFRVSHESLRKSPVEAQAGIRSPLRIPSAARRGFLNASQLKNVKGTVQIFSDPILRRSHIGLRFDVNRRPRCCPKSFHRQRQRLPTMERWTGNLWTAKRPHTIEHRLLPLHKDLYTTHWGHLYQNPPDKRGFRQKTDAP
ncbi:hypothetical protein IF1G_10873 [Cordyceps javanica]|uniref:Uncharacterized protein n=1 Tax=Cordyceps javanica TaxID=43265 RepID=A0A545VJS8_9HYPO|nr:hypothetical protein IF1G_10873 [Cordyceps javanica]TQW01984.1 hypothetical protein IF2G_10555 [Cordyceps javanica]